MYDDKTIRITDKELVIRGYYFPFGAARTIPLESLQRVELKRLTLLGGAYRLWGMGALPVWFHWDKNRFRKKFYIELDLGNWLKIGITPDDLQAVLAELRRRLPGSRLKLDQAPVAL